MENQLISFVQKFFNNLNANCTFEKDVLTITNVPLPFQKFYGKNEPYYFTTNKNKISNEIEFLDKSSYIIKTISAYLESSGQNTLLKIDFKEYSEDKITNNILKTNFRITKLKPRKKFDIFFRFTFHTSFQYLNEKSKVINEIYIHDNKVINGDLNEYPVVEGKKSEINIPDMKEPYFIAKNELVNKLKIKKDELSNELNLKLNKAIDRINSHFNSEEKELKTNFEKAIIKLQELKREGNLSKIDKQEKIIQNIKEKLNPEERERDKERSILIEKHRHGLNVNNKLFNTTLIYHPIFSYDAIFENAYIKKNVEINFNPLTEEIEPFVCESCNSKTNEIYLCSNGHLSCKNCLTHCESCGKEFCKKCVSTKCELCSANICKDCKTRCFGCGKIICKTHVHKEKITGRDYCNRCLTRCDRCGEFKVGSNFKKSKKTGASICEDCFRREMQDSALKGVFEN